jgi:ATP-binding cassette subfamily G (WHITE) protein 2 (SNQ2)
MLWGSNIQPQQSRDSRRNPWHDEYIQDGREEVETPGESDDSRSQSGIDRNAGTWGERDAGRLDTRTAAEDLHVLREELAALSRTRSQGAQSERNDGLFKTVSRKSARNDGLSRTLSRKSTRQNVPRRASMADHERRSSDAHTHDDDMGSKTDEEPGDIGAVAAEKEDDFELGEFMKEGHFEKRKDGQSAKKVGVVYKNLTVKGVGSTASFVRTLPDAVLGTFGPDLYHLVSGWIPALRMGRHKQTRTLIHDFSGVVKE